ncbi:penicillin-binding protein 2 [bacterium]|nr:penicillin-binding protein 2 [bacterium]
MVRLSRNRLLSFFRLEILARLILVIFVLITLRLAYLQLYKGDNYRRRVTNQSTRKVWVNATRGEILDRNGEIIAYNSPERNVLYEASVYSKRAQSNAVTRLAYLLRCLPGELSENLKPKKRLPDGTAILARNVSESSFTRVAERSDEIPGLKLDYEAARRYPFGSLFGHVTGYTGLIRASDKRLQDPAAGPYHINDIVGREGMEYVCDDILHGRNGRRMVEVDRVGRYTGILLQEDAVPGQDIITTLDLRLQRAAAEAMKGKVGAAVMVDIKSGEILALVSSPSYDPNLFIGGISQTNYALLRDDPNHPLLNRATQGLYPLGSVFKLVTSLAGLETGVFTAKTIYHDDGEFQIGNHTIHNYHKAVYGSITLEDALRVSCNTFFCYYANQIGADNLAKYARALGLGDRTGVELPSEAYGQVPTPIWKKNIQGESWYPGDTVNLAIGHGFILVTPVQIARMAAALATGGDVMPLTLIKGLRQGGVTIAYNGEKPPVRHSEFKPEALQAVREGMYAVVNKPNGSGRRAKVKGLTLCGKTGSAMLGRKTFAWFASYAPYEDPEVALAIVVENATSGGTDAAPIAGEIYKTYSKVRTKPSEEKAKK